MKSLIRKLLIKVVLAFLVLAIPLGIKVRDFPRRMRRALGFYGPAEGHWRALGYPPMAGGANIVGQRSPLYWKKVAGGHAVILDTSKFTGNIFYVDSAVGVDSAGYGSTPDAPLATIDYAIGLCTANQGDVILVLPGHAETLATAGAIAADVAGVTIIGLGVGAAKPTLTFSATAASVLITAANVKMGGFRITPSVDSVTNPFHVQAAGCELDFEVLETDDAVEFVRAVLTTAAADRLTVNIRYMGRSGGDACVNAVRLVGCDGGRIQVDFYGKASTAVVQFITTACTDIIVTGYMYVSGTTDGSKLVVATIGGSTWWADIFDGAAGAPFSGGSGSDLAKDDLSAVTDALYGANGIGTFPSAAAPANSVSLAEVIRDIWAALQGTAAGENGIQAWPASAAPANNVSLAEVMRIIFDSLVGTAGVATFPAGAAAADTISIAEVLRYAQENIITGTGTVLPANQSLYDLLAGANGIVAWAAAAAPANGVSISEAIRYIVEILWGVLVNTGGTATMGGILGDVANVSVASRLITLRDALFDTTGIAAFPAAAVPGNGVSIAEVLRDVWDALRNGTGGSEPGANKSIVDAIGFDGVAAVAASAGMVRTMAGVLFVVKKTLTSSDVVQAGVDVTGASSVGDLLVEDYTVQADATGLATGTLFTLETNNVKGSAVFHSNALAGHGANTLMDKKSATLGKSVVLESGKKVIAKCTVADCTGAGTVDVYLLCRRLADNATLAAA